MREESSMELTVAAAMAEAKTLDAQTRRAQDLFVQAWLVVAGAGIHGAQNRRVPRDWADQLLEDFRERWPDDLPARGR